MVGPSRNHGRPNIAGNRVTAASNAALQTTAINHQAAADSGPDPSSKSAHQAAGGRAAE